MTNNTFQRRALSASTTHPNNEETDQLLEVLHDVDVVVDEHGTIETVRFMATDPVAAMAAIRDMNDDAFRQLPRVPVH